MATTETNIEVLDRRRAAIPEVRPVDGWKQLPIRETERSHEPLVALGIFSDHHRVFTSSVYADEHHNSPYHGGLEGSLTALFVREGVADRLEKAADMLPTGYHLMAMDTYRPLEVQAALYEQYYDGLKDQHPDWSGEELSKETQKYVSLPSSDETRPSPHNTGASVDVVLIRVEDDVQDAIAAIDESLKTLGADNWQEGYLLEMRRSELLRRHGKMLDFGVPFDYGGPEAALRYYEELAQTRQLSPDEQACRDNRRLLYHTMTAAGFEPYADEFWHYNDPASQMGAQVAGREYAEYGAAHLSTDNRAFAEMRALHHLNSVRLARGEAWRPPRELKAQYELARRAIRGNNPRNIWHMTSSVAKIEPPKASQQKIA